jgi:hypothetical protein
VHIWAPFFSYIGFGLTELFLSSKEWNFRCMIVRLLVIVNILTYRVNFFYDKNPRHFMLFNKSPPSLLSQSRKNVYYFFDIKTPHISVPSYHLKENCRHNDNWQNTGCNFRNTTPAPRHNHNLTPMQQIFHQVRMQQHTTWDNNYGN